MKKCQWIPRIFSAKHLVCLSGFLALTAKSQWVPDGPPNVLDCQFMTTGGITYFRLVGLLPGGLCCQRLAGYGVARQDSALTQILEQETWGSICVGLYCEARPAEWVSVLGALPPGGYTLTLRASSEFAFPWATLSFTVPTNANPTLNISTTTNSNGSMLRLGVAGVSKAVYVLESSTNLTSWTAVKTSSVAPVTFSLPMTNGSKWFYRTSIWPTATH